MHSGGFFKTIIGFWLADIPEFSHYTPVLFCQALNWEMFPKFLFVRYSGQALLFFYGINLKMV